MRKGLIYWLAILLAVLPLLGSFSKEAAAASTRVAVIKELKGTVKVKKAGGSKEFTAFAKMSLNEGDVLAAGSGGSAVLQFANGTSEDDKLTVASNTKLTFSKLSNKKGTTTKVSMWSGSAWVDVKSITNKDDQFTLETPTAVMGVRGTHLLVTVNPDTGATNLMVAAGVVQTTSTAGGGQSQNVYPTQNALITKDGEDGSDVTIAPADLETLMQQGDAEIVKAIIQGAKDITAENEQYVQRYESGEVPKEIGGTNADLERFKNNTQNLLGALVTQAVHSGLITQERMNQLIEEAGNQTGFKVDVTKSSLQLTEAEKAKQEAQRKKEEALAKREAERKAKEESERKKLEDTIRKLEEERKAKEKAALEAAEAKKKQAQEKYESQLSEAEKNRLRADAIRRQEETKAAQNSASPTPRPSSGSSSGPGPGPALSNNANLNGLRVTLPGSSENLIVFNGAANTYTITVPNTTGSVIVKPTLEQTNASVTVKGEQLIGGEASIALLSSGTSDGTTTTIPVVVTAQNGSTKKTYTLIVNRQASLLTAPITILGVDGFVFKPDQGTYTLNPVAETTSSLMLDFGSLPSGVNVSVTNNSMSVSPQNGAYIVPLAKGNNKIVITVFSGGAMTIQNYTINVTRAASNDTSISAAFINFGGERTEYLIPNELGNYEITATEDWARLDMIPTQAGDGAILVVKKGNEIVSPEHLALDMGINVFSIIVTAPDGVTTRTYTLTITKNEAVPLFLTSWSVAESLNGAPIKRIYEGEGEGGYEFTASVAVAESTDVIHFNMLLENGDVIPEFVHVFDKNGSEVGDGYTNEGDGIQISEELLLNSAEEGPYTTIRVEYYIQGEETRFNLELIVLRGEPGEEDYIEVDGVSLIYGESHMVNAFAYDERSFIGMIGAEGMDFGFWIIPQVNFDDEVVNVYQIIDGARVRLDENFMGFMPKVIEAGWNDFEIDVWDYSVQRSKQMYDLHVFRGMDVPEAFAGIAFVADGIPAIGESIGDASQWYVEVPEGTDEALIIPSGVHGDVSLVDVSVLTGFYEREQLDLEPGDGYFHLPVNGESSLVFTFESGGRQFVYTVRAVPDTTFALDYVKLFNESDYQHAMYEDIYFNEDEYDKSFTIPSNVTHLSLQPFIENDYSELRVTVDGVEKLYNYSGRNSTTRFSIVSGKPIVIEITSPSGYSRKTYTFTLNRPYVSGGLNSLLLTPIDEQNFSLLSFIIPVSLGDNEYFSNYRGNEANLLLNVQKVFGSGDVNVYLDGSAEPLPGDGYNFELIHLSEGWHYAHIAIDDSQNSGSPAMYKHWIYVGEQPPSGFDFDGIYAEDVAEHIIEFQQDAADPFKWNTEVVPGVVFIGKVLIGGDSDASVTKVVYSDGLLADDSDGPYEIPIVGDTTDAQMWVEHEGVTFVYQLQIHTSMYEPPYVAGLSSQLTWMYDSVKKYVANTVLDENVSLNGITVHMTPAEGYTITYLAENGEFDSVTGQWTGLSVGLNTLLVTVHRGVWDDTYTFELTVED